MSITTTAAPARTDTARTGTASTDGSRREQASTGAAKSPTLSMPSTVAVRRAGLALTAGAAIWAFQVFAWGINPTEGFAGRWNAAFSLAFQLGVFALLRVQYASRATGTSRAAVALLKVEHGLLGLATLWTTIVLVSPAAGDTLPVQVLDAFWPLSMLGMMVIGIKIAFAGRWRSAARGWPVVAESWAVVSVPALGIFGPGVGGAVGGTHLLVGYATLGLVLALRPHLTGAVD